MTDSLITRFQNPPRMSVAANRDHLERLLYELIAEGATELDSLYGELERLTGPLVADRGSENERLSAEVARLQQELEVARRDGERTFDAGWKMAAAWACRDDLLADMDSNTFKADRLAAIDAARAGEGEG